MQLTSQLRANLESAILSVKRDQSDACRVSIMGKCYCAVGCSNRFYKGCGLHFYRFPVDTDRRNRWTAAVNRKNWQPSVYTWICSAHFVGGSKSDDPTSPAYVPSLFGHLKSPLKRKVERQLARYERTSQCKRRRLQAWREDEAAGSSRSATEDSSSVNVVADAHPLPSPLESDSSQCEQTAEQPSVSVMTDVTMETISRLESECITLREENQKLKLEINVLKPPDKFLDNPSKVCYFTGLPSMAVLIAVFDFVSVCVSTSRSALPPFQQYLMVLMKLRLNVDNELLSSLFHVHASTVSRYFQKWICVMYERMKPLVMWPDQEQLHKTMPMEFRKNFGRCIVIIDCFEVFMERPKGLMARAQTWSNYKHHNTVKFLIGISPQGSITYVSKGWGGRVSDQYLTQSCGILEHLLPGDLVLADRGFNVQESASLFCAEVKLPPFTKGKRQLSQCEVDRARQLSRVRIHVERVIGLLRQKYKILSGTLPINFIKCSAGEEYSTIDKIVTICSALCNCCESVVPFD